MSLMMSLSCVVVVLVVCGVIIAINPSWLSNMFGNKPSPGVVDWATGAPGGTAAPTQAPYVYPVPPLNTPYPAYGWAQGTQR